MRDLAARFNTPSLDVIEEEGRFSLGAPEFAGLADPTVHGATLTGRSLWYRTDRVMRQCGNECHPTAAGDRVAA